VLVCTGSNPVYLLSQPAIGRYKKAHSRGERTSVKPDPLELRVYSGSDADFMLYEDEGDSYDYEHGAYSIIPLHWDDKAETLTIGNRNGNFPGMLEHRTFRIFRVSDAHAVGITSAAKPDATVGFDGRPISVRVPLSPGQAKLKAAR
jgi:alpha-D-xyloside xylohydrolase